MHIFDISFLYPGAFILFAIFVVVFFLPKKGYKIATFKDLQKVYKKNNIFSKILTVLWGCIFSCFVFLIALPYTTNVDTTLKKNGVDIMIAFDVSYSMEATDILPSRIEVAKKVSQEFISGIGADRLGLVLFAGRPFVGIPLSFDYNFLQSYISRLSTNTINQQKSSLQGTAIGDALVLAKHQLINAEKEQENSEKKREKIVILLTDGEANSGIDPMLGVKLLKENNIKVYTIGIGGEKDTQIETYDVFGRRQTLKIGGVDEKTLKAIADMTGGEYFRGTSRESMEQIFASLEKLVKTEVEVQQKTRFEYHLQLLSYLILVFGYMSLGIILFKKVRI